MCRDDWVSSLRTLLLALSSPLVHQLQDRYAVLWLGEISCLVCKDGSAGLNRIFSLRIGERVYALGWIEVVKATLSVTENCAGLLGTLFPLSVGFTTTFGLGFPILGASRASHR